MRPYRATAITVGILFIACSAASVLSALPVGAILADPDYLSTLAGSAGSVVLTALIEFIWAATAAGIAIALYPILERFHPGWAFGAVAARLVEGTFILAGTLSLLVLLSVSQQSVAAGAPIPSSFQQIGDTLLVTRDWLHGFIVLLAFCLGALMYNYVFFASRLIPRWLTVWGLAGATLMAISTIYAGFTESFGFSTITTVLNIPIGIQELVLAVWLIVRGFNPLPADSRATKARSDE